MASGIIDGDGILGISQKDIEQLEQEITIVNVNGNLPYASVGTKTTDKYLTVKAAVDAGESNIIISENITETSNISITRDTNLTVYPGVNWNIGNYNITLVGDNIDFSWIQEPFSSKIIAAYNSSRFVFQTSGQNNKVILNSLNIDISNSTSSEIKLFDYNFSDIVLNGVNIVTYPNKINCGVHVGETQNYLNSGILILNKEGTDRDFLYNCYSNSHDDNIVISGLFNTDEVILSTNRGKQRIRILDSLVETYKLNIGSTLDGVSYKNNLASFDIHITANEAIIKDSNLNSGNIYCYDKSKIKIINSSSTGDIDISDSDSNFNFVNNCDFNSITMGGNDNKLVNCIFLGGVTDTGLRNAKVGVQTSLETQSLVSNVDIDGAGGNVDAGEF
jgi:hypothetical protein